MDQGLLREIESDVRRERYRNLWDRFGFYVMSFVGLVFSVAGGYVIYDYIHKAALQQDSDLLISALQTEENGDPVAQLVQLAQDGSGGYPVLARLHLAAQMLAEGNNVAAAEWYKEAASIVAEDSEWRGWTMLRAVYAEFDALSQEQIARLLADQMSEGAAWRPFAFELIALASLREGKIEEARMHFDTIIIAADTPPSMRARALELRVLLKEAETGVPADETPNKNE